MKKNILTILIITAFFLLSYFQVLSILKTNQNKNMADPVWGLLPKAQDDAETIEQAIVRFIAEHETDSGAHTGSGESLETHKSQEIVDHPAESLVADKLASANSFIYIPLNSSSDHDPDNHTSLNVGLISSLTQSSPLTGNASDFVFDFGQTDYRYNDGDIVVDMLFWGGGSAGTWEGSFATPWAKIEIKHGYYRVGYYDGGWTYTSWVAFTAEYPSRWRIIYSAGDGTLTFLKNGVSIFEVAFVIDFHGEEITGTFFVDRGTSTNGYVNYGDLKIAFDSTII